MKNELRELLATKKVLQANFHHYLNTEYGRQVMSELERAIGLVIAVNIQKKRYA